MKAIITVGVSASGKTTWAKQYAKETGAIISNRDDLRFSLTASDNWGEYDFNSRKPVESLISEIQRTTLAHAALRKLDIVCADTNLNKYMRNNLIAMCKEYGYEVEVKPFPVTLEEAWSRDMQRQYRVGYEVLERQYKQWEEFLQNG